jgi:hypothetical protein
MDVMFKNIVMNVSSEGKYTFLNQGKIVPWSVILSSGDIGYLARFFDLIMRIYFF